MSSNQVVSVPGGGQVKDAPKAVTAGAVAVAVGAAIATLVILLSLRAPDPAMGYAPYLLGPLPYVALIILALVFRRTFPGAVISLIGALVLGGWGVYWTYGWRDAIELALLPLVLFAGCGVLLLVQLIRWAVMRGRHQQSR
jgi:hypothetical protein